MLTAFKGRAYPPFCRYRQAFQEMQLGFVALEAQNSEETQTSEKGLRCRALLVGILPTLELRMADVRARPSWFLLDMSVHASNHHGRSTPDALLARLASVRHLPAVAAPDRGSHLADPSERRVPAEPEREFIGTSGTIQKWSARVAGWLRDSTECTAACGA